jgi:hypothetical protein
MKLKKSFLYVCLAALLGVLAMGIHGSVMNVKTDGQWAKDRHEDSSAAQ